MLSIDSNIIEIIVPKIADAIAPNIASQDVSVPTPIHVKIPVIINSTIRTIGRFIFFISFLLYFSLGSLQAVNNILIQHFLSFFPVRHIVRKEHIELLTVIWI